MRTSALQKAFILDGSVYLFYNQSNPRDVRFKTNASLHIAGQPSPSSGRRIDYAQLLWAISKWYEPEATPQYHLFNHLYLNQLSETPLNEYWLKTKRGWIYFVANSSENKVFRWRGTNHAASELIADFSDSEMAFKSLPYVALNPQVFDNAFGTQNAILGRQVKDVQTLNRCYHHNVSFTLRQQLTQEFWSFSDCAGKTFNKQQDFLRDVYVEFSNSLGLDFRHAQILEYRNRAGRLLNFPVTLEPKQILMYQNHPYDDNPSSEEYFSHHRAYFSQLSASNGVVVTAPADSVDFNMGFRRIDATKSRSRNSIIRVSHSALNWTISVVAIVVPKRQTEPGTILAPYSGNLDPSQWQYFDTSGWSTPILKISLGSSTCHSFRKEWITYHSSGARLLKLSSPRDPERFKCFFSTPLLAQNEERPIVVHLEDGSRFVTNVKAKMRQPGRGSSFALEVWQAPQTCEQACKFSGGVADLNEQRKQQLCRESSTGGQLYGGYRPSSSGIGCSFRKELIPGRRQANIYTTYYGPENARVAAVSKMCFCKFRSQFYFSDYHYNPTPEAEN